MKLFLKRVKRKLFQQQVYVFGDSHAEVFEHISSKEPFYKYRFLVKKVGGATAQGMRNPNSKTNALNIFLEEVNNIPSKRAQIYMLLGEVDTGFVIWYRAQKYKESVESQLKESIQAYVDFLDTLKQKGFKRITVFSAPLPTIEDNQTWGEIASARKEVTATKRERTDLTLRYNAWLKTECNKRKLKFVDCDNDLLDSGTGFVKNHFKNVDPNNHHLDVEKYAAVIRTKL